jgi:hypothetical protein
MPPRKTSARVVMNRAALNEVGEAVAMGIEVALEVIVREADPPDAPPYGQGLKQRGGWIVYHGTKKVAGGSISGKQPRKPRERLTPGAITGIAGFGFPGRFQEMGTVHHSAQPFLWPALLSNLDNIDDLMAPATRAHLNRSR